MAPINILLEHLDERTIARQVAMPFDTARLNYRGQTSNVVGNFDQFTEIITEFYKYIFSRCISNGGELSSTQAWGWAKELLEREYRKKRGDIVSAFNDSNTGVNGGLRVILDTITEVLKAEAVERYISAVFDRVVAPNSWDQKVEIIREFIAYCGPNLSGSIETSQPERYAQNFNELIRAYVEGLRQTSSMFRRL